MPTSSALCSSALYPALFVNHGGGPLPLLGAQRSLASHMKSIPTNVLASYPKPTAIVVISAHWEADPIRITSHASPAKLLFDYHNFPKEAYEYQYPAPGSPRLSQRIQTLLQKSGIQAELEDARGLDHGVFVPLIIMYPEADIPVVCVSLHSSLDANVHISIGEALAPLRQTNNLNGEENNILILGSGYSFHNMEAFFNPTRELIHAANEFNDWLKATMMDSSLSWNQRKDRLVGWESAPGARLCHPREEHLLPLLVAAAAATNSDKCVAKVVYDTSGKDDKEGNYVVSGYAFI